MLLFFIYIVHVDKKYIANFSEYKRDEQIHLLRKMGFKNISNPLLEGYIPNKMYEIKNDEFSYNFVANKIGLRGEINGLLDTNTYKILFLGDPFIEGYGAKNNQTLPFYLNCKLQKINKDITEINGGISGSNPISQINFFYNKSDDYNFNIYNLYYILCSNAV